ncbi:helix-turn-helix domain-containing protein [Streptomyces sp. T028]|uniref:helix-turn-helix domain-containing protein n=1 Tax=Streptomyces sp. T028 TaxID=3394379 RepID=UPI003A8469B0
MDQEQARKIGERLRSARRQRGMSLRKLAEAANVSVGYLSMVENGHRHLPVVR